MNTTGEILKFPISEEIIALDHQFFPQPWTLKQWRELKPEHFRLYGHRQEGKLMGFCLFQIVPGDNLAHLLKIITDPQFQGLGITHSFWKYVCQELISTGIERVFLEVESTNSRALQFYQRQGFVFIRRVMQFYSNGDSADIMQLTLRAEMV